MILTAMNTWASTRQTHNEAHERVSAIAKFATIVLCVCYREDGDEVQKQHIVLQDRYSASEMALLMLHVDR